MNERVIVGLRRDQCFTARCSCGAVSEPFSVPAAGVRWLLDHVGTEHPHFYEEFKTATAPPAEYTQDTVPVPAFVALMGSMMDAITPRRSNDRPQRRDRRPL